jgi:hypothetical protein
MIKVNTQGLDDILNELANLSVEIKEEVDAELYTAAHHYRELAVKDSPEYDGRLRGSIGVSEIKGGYEVFAKTKYAAYMEFGTKSKYRAIPGIDASKYRGKGEGNFKQFLASLTKWVQKKGFASTFINGSSKRSKKKSAILKEKQAAYAIANSILKHGVKPHPFFFKHREVVFPELLKRLENIFR